MHIHVNGRNLEITPDIKSYAKEKLGKVANHYDQIQAIDIVLTVIKNPSVAVSHVAEVNCKLNNAIVRVEEQAESVFASIDLVSDKLDRQIKKVKDKNLRAKTKFTSIRTEVPEEEEEEAVAEAD